MRLHQNPPGRGGQVKRVHWNYVGTEGGLKNQWSAYVAGPCHWFICHEVGRTKPCLSEISNDTLACPYCAQLLETKEVGYQPLYREMDGKPVMVVVHDYSREIIDRLTFHQRVNVMRGLGITDAVCVTPAAVQTPRYTSTLAERNKPADISESLVKMWKIPELTAYFSNQRVTETTTVAQTPPPTKVPKLRVRTDGKPFGPMTNAAAEKVGCPEAPPATLEAYNEVLKKAKQKAEERERKQIPQ